MLANRPLRFSIPAGDLVRAKRFYADVLGLNPINEGEFALNYRSGESYFSIVPSEHAGNAPYSLMTWLIADLDEAMTELRGRGITFEDYDLPFLKTINGAATFPNGDRVAWFKDSEGNLLALAQMT
jgi:catechol 2,3-dioxygenase-like lactoylglutathione lyase family enzyme